MSNQDGHSGSRVCPACNQPIEDADASVFCVYCETSFHARCIEGMNDKCIVCGNFGGFPKIEMKRNRPTRMAQYARGTRKIKWGVLAIGLAICIASIVVNLACMVEINRLENMIVRCQHGCFNCAWCSLDYYNAVILSEFNVLQTLTIWFTIVMVVGVIICALSQNYRKVEKKLSKFFGKIL